MPRADRSRGPLRSLLTSLSRGDRLALAVYVALSLGSALLGSLAALLLVPLIQPGQAAPLGEWGIAWRPRPDLLVLAFLATTASFAWLRWQSARVGARLVGRYGLDLRRRVHASLVDAPLASLADATSAEIANVLTYNIEIVVQGFTALQQLLVAGVTAAVSLAFAFWLSPGLVLAMPLLMAVGMAASRLFGREQARVSRQYVTDMTTLFWHSEDFPRRLRHVRSFGREASEKASYGAISARLAHGYARQVELVASGRMLLELVGAFGIATVLVLARHWQGIDPASLIAVCLLLGRLFPYMVSSRQSFQQLRSAVPAFELWERYARLGADAVAPVAACPPGTLRIVRLRVVPPAEGVEVRDLDLVPGRMILVFGDSGIGKSSLVDVLAGMAEPEVFEAMLDGRSLAFGRYRDVVRHGAYVGQNVRPWQTSVRECLLWAAPTADEGALRDALADVGLDVRLARASDGLDTALHGSSSRLSGGELQRLMLAQVILRQPALAVLDEATSALDAASERTVLERLKHRLPRTILIVVSHRADVATIADRTLHLGSATALPTTPGNAHA
ncbi:ATP-binding cassette domain-containing protein [Luteibacter sp. 9135]|uniref:ATP-binding cassette domain-containing protein n=1 Tax=Luteibacter sp. 9135 TaxID=1500893 RepID=UPI00068B7D16|nr:ABC transporter ATP-binding protein [Luteibacter sp. 9135]